MAIGELVVRIIGDSTQLTQDLIKAGKETEGFAAKGRAAVNTFGKAAAGAFAAAGAAAAALAVQTAQQIRELDALATVANTSVAEFQRMAYATRTVGIEQDKLADILKDVNDRVGDFNATGGGPMADFFEKIAPRVGVTAEQFRNLSGPQALQLYVDSLQKANLSQADMTFYMEAMASDSTRLIPLLKDGGAAMAGLAAEAEALGLGLSAVDVAKVQAANAELAKVGAIVDSGAQALSVELMPVIGAAAEAFREMVQDAGGFGPIIQKSMSFAASAVGVFADGLRGIQLIAKGVELGFEGFALAVTTIFKKINEGVDWLINGAIWNINRLIDAANMLPGVALGSIEEFTSQGTVFFTEAAAGWSDAMAGTMAEMHDLAMRPLPSDGIKAWLAEVQSNAQVAAEAVAAAQQGVSTEGGAPVGMVGLSTEEQDALTKRIDAIRQATMTERELMVEKYALDLEDLKLARENKLITEQEYDALELERFVSHMDALGEIEQAAAAKREATLEQERQAKLAVAQGMFSNLSTLMNTGSRKLFEIGKAASIANALVSGYEAVVSSYAAGAKIGGPVVGAAYAATAAAATFAQIKQIRASSFGQSAAPVTFDGGVPTVPTSQPGQTGGAGSGGAGRNVSISLVGETFSRDQVRGLIDAFNTEINDGYKLTVTGG